MSRDPDVLVLEKLGHVGWSGLHARRVTRQVLVGKGHGVRQGLNVIVTRFRCLKMSCTAHFPPHNII